jgi:hypothetical protein
MSDIPVPLSCRESDRRYLRWLEAGGTESLLALAESECGRELQNAFDRRTSRKAVYAPYVGGTWRLLRKYAVRG